MHSAPIRDNEQQRLEALHRYGLFGTDPEEAYDKITRLVTAICHTPIAILTLIGEDQVWFKSRINVADQQGERQTSICGHALYEQNLLVVDDTTQDPRFADNPNVLQGVRFYAGAPLKTPDGHAIGTLCTIDHQPRQLTDAQIEALRALADQVMAQMELSRAHHVLQQQAEALAQANHELSEKNQALERLNANKDRFFSIIAHDLKAPFQGILGFSEILDTDLDEMSSQEIRNIANYLHDTASSAYKLLENLLQWALLERGEMRFHPKKMLVETIFDLVEGSLSAAAHHKNIELSFYCPRDLHVYGDENMLRSVLRNFVANAVKFTPAGGRVAVRACIDADCLEWSIADTGVGMSAEQQAQLFQIEVANSTRGTAGESGTGLGLMLCHQFVLRHQGSIRIQSAPHQGSTFFIRLPTTLATAQPQEQAVQA